MSATSVGGAGLRAVGSAVCSVCGLRRSKDEGQFICNRPIEEVEPAKLRGGEGMRQSEFVKTRWMASGLAIAVLVAGTGASPIRGQEKTAAATEQARGYDVSREVTLIGKVTSYSASYAVAPLGPHVTLQTPSGTIDVHLGNARLLQANHLAIESGDTLRIIGEEVALGNGKQFVARIVQKGTQAVVVRSAGGFPLSPAAAKDAAKANAQGGAR